MSITFKNHQCGFWWNLWLAGTTTCRIPSNGPTYCLPAIVQLSRPTWVIWFSNMSLLGPWPRAVGPCEPCLAVKFRFCQKSAFQLLPTPHMKISICWIICCSTFKIFEHLKKSGYTGEWDLIISDIKQISWRKKTTKCQDTTWEGALHQRFHLLLLSVTKCHQWLWENVGKCQIMWEIYILKIHQSLENSSNDTLGRLGHGMSWYFQVSQPPKLQHTQLSVLTSLISHSSS